MMGPYCLYCDFRCFVYRVLPDRSWAGLMATCQSGMERDLIELGYDYRTADNPYAWD